MKVPTRTQELRNERINLPIRLELIIKSYENPNTGQRAHMSHIHQPQKVHISIAKRYIELLRTSGKLKMNVFGGKYRLKKKKIRAGRTDHLGNVKVLSRSRPPSQPWRIRSFTYSPLPVFPCCTSVMTTASKKACNFPLHSTQNSSFLN